MTRSFFQLARFAQAPGRRRALRRELAELSDHILRDVGIEVGRRGSAADGLFFLLPF